MKILYNGSTGSLGSYFQEALVKRRISGVALFSRLENNFDLKKELSNIPADMFTPRERVVLVHMAAMVSVPACEKNPQQARKTNVEDTTATIREFVSWAHDNSYEPQVIYVSTGHIYAAQPAGTKIDESSALKPRSVYAITKLEAETHIMALADTFKFSLRIARVFGLVAPRQPPFYVLPGLIGRVKKGTVDAIPGLDFYRDYLDSRDVCDRLILLAGNITNGEAPVVNVCSGYALQLREIVCKIIKELHGEDDATALIQKLGSAPGRADDIPYIVGNPSRLESLIGEEARRITIGQTIRDALHQ
jgi:nucleoside-diphosphate-sugar epimerase